MFTLLKNRYILIATFLVNLSIFAYSIYSQFSLQNYVNIFVIETICILLFFILELTILTAYEVLQKRQTALKGTLAILGNILLCTLVYGFILFTIYFIGNKEIILGSHAISTMFFGQLLNYKGIAIVLFLIYFIDFILVTSQVRTLDTSNWFYLKPHIRMLVFFACLTYALMYSNLYILLLVKILLDGFYYLTNSPIRKSTI